MKGFETCSQFARSSWFAQNLGPQETAQDKPWLLLALMEKGLVASLFKLLQCPLGFDQKLCVPKVIGIIYLEPRLPHAQHAGFSEPFSELDSTWNFNLLTLDSLLVPFVEVYCVMFTVAR